MRRFTRCEAPPYFFTTIVFAYGIALKFPITLWLVGYGTMEAHMQKKTTVSDALDARFFTPLRRPRTRRVGVELEFPIWSRTPGTATDFAAARQRWR